MTDPRNAGLDEMGELVVVAADSELWSASIGESGPYLFADECGYFLDLTGDFC